MVTCWAKQAHVKRRQEYDPAHRENGEKRRRKTGEFGDLSNVPVISEVCIIAYSCPVPEEPRIAKPGIEENSGRTIDLVAQPELAVHEHGYQENDQDSDGKTSD